MRVSGALSAALLFFVASSMSFASPEALKSLDTGNDGTIDLPEAQVGGTKVFKTLDPDEDGSLNGRELEGRLDGPAVKAADPDGDGTLDAKEYADLVEKRFRATDADENGEIDADELPSSAGAELLRLTYE